jgi:hypothetical protein
LAAKVAIELLRNLSKQIFDAFLTVRFYDTLQSGGFVKEFNERFMSELHGERFAKELEFGVALNISPSVLELQLAVMLVLAPSVVRDLQEFVGMNDFGLTCEDVAED